MKPPRRYRLHKNCRGRSVMQNVLVASLVLIFSAQAATTAWPQDPKITPPESVGAIATDPDEGGAAEQHSCGSICGGAADERRQAPRQLGEVAETDFALRTIKNDRMTELRIPYDQLRSVRILGRPQTRGRSFRIPAVRRAQLVMGLEAGGILLGITAYARG